MTPIASVRIYPEPGTRFVRVKVWPTLRALEAYRRREKHRPLGGIASCTEKIWWRHVGGRLRREPVVAEVNFHRRALGMEVVTHEFFHATLAWGRRIGFDWSRLGAEDAVNDDEERLTYVHGRLCAEFVTAAEKLGLYDPKRWES